MSIDINKHQVDIENLFKQNELDLNSIKELYKRIEKINNEISLLKRKGQLFDKINSSNNNQSLKELKEEFELLKSEITVIRNKLSKAIFIEPAEHQSIPCTSISLNQKSLSFNSFTQQTLVANISPSNTTDNIIWKSSNNNVATVNNGLVTVVGNGNCVITVTCGSQVASCNIIVEIDSSVTNYSITNNLTNMNNNNSSTTINENSSYTATLSPNDGYEISSVTITMGGNDITSSAYSNGAINISNVTGNLVITGVANQIQTGGNVTPFGTFAIGQLSSPSASTLNTSITSAVGCVNTGELNSGSVIGFSDSSLYSTYKFAYGLKTGSWIQGTSGAYHTENVTIAETGSYGIMIIKINSSGFSDSELTEINTSFGVIN